MKKWSTSRNVSGLCLIGLLWLGTVQTAIAQCPTSEEVTIQLSEKQTFAQNQGEIKLSSKVTALTSFRVRLYDTDKNQYVYDDNNPEFLNQISAPTKSNREIMFAGLPKGKYELELHGGECQYQRYQIAITRE